jgi:hypothetical protein
MNSRFDYIKYDQVSEQNQLCIKLHVVTLEKRVDELVRNQRAKASAMRCLEEFYMWIGKGIREDQLEREQFPDLHETGRKA